MTDHAQRAQELAEDCRVRDERSVTWITKALTQAHAAGRREGLEAAKLKVQSLCNDEVRFYIQDKSGCDHPDVDAAHNGNAARVADNFRIWCHAKTKEVSHE